MANGGKFEWSTLVLPSNHHNCLHQRAPSEESRARKMAFQSMMNGSECSTGSNPLNALLKQQSNNDNSLYNQFNHPSTHATTSLRSATPTNAAEADRFYAQQSQSNNFDLQGLRRELLNTNNRSQQAQQHQEGKPKRFDCRCRCRHHVHDYDDQKKD